MLSLIKKHIDYLFFNESELLIWIRMFKIISTKTSPVWVGFFYFLIMLLYPFCLEATGGKPCFSMFRTQKIVGKQNILK